MIFVRIFNRRDAGFSSPRPEHGERGFSMQLDSQIVAQFRGDPPHPRHSVPSGLPSPRERGEGNKWEWTYGFPYFVWS